MIAKEKMQAIYEQVKTPYKYGAVFKREGYYYDSPVVFKRGDRYFSSCVEIDAACATGYRTKLFSSKNLLDWEEVGYILTENNGWDSAQTGGYAQFIDNEFGGSNEIKKVGGKYLFAYLGGAHKGYETDPLWMGLAVCDEMERLDSYRKFPEPILTTLDGDCRLGESATLYKADMFEDDAKTLGYPYVMAYNAKGPTGRESIFLAVSKDGYAWERYGEKAVIAVEDCSPETVINGDPQIVRLDGLYVMFYFMYDGKKAWNTFAASEDLLHWTKWEGEPLVQSEHAWENVFAHKQWILKEGDEVYHFYCAVNDKNERFVALATKNEIRR